LMENRHRLLLGIKVESFRGPAAEMDGGRALLDRFHATQNLRIQTVGADKGYFAKPFLTALVRRRITPHMATKTTGRETSHQRGRRLSRTVGYRLSQRARKKIEELLGEAKCWHGFRRFQWRGLLQVRDEAYLMGWLLNLKRLTTLRPAPA
jgi:Transposase DDE domain